MSEGKDAAVVRRLAAEVAEISQRPIQDERRALWRLHNGLQDSRPPVLVRWLVAMDELIPQSLLECKDSFYRAHERALRAQIMQDWIGDDSVVEPWITQRATCVTPPEGLWGVKCERQLSPESGGSWKDIPSIRDPQDVCRLVQPHHRIDEDATARDVARLQEAVGDLLPVNVDRSPAYMADGSLCARLCYLRGLEQVMWDMHDNSKWLHELLAFMRDGILTVCDEAEAAGDWHLANHQNQAMPYATDLPDPCANGPSVSPKALWTFMQSQELTLVSPSMFDEFMLQYQLATMARFGLVAYGCCEDLTRKIPYLRQIPNLRRIAVTPWANVQSCAEQIGQEYVLSWRPNPAEMVCAGFDPDRIRRILLEGMQACSGCHVDITLKDVKTVQGHPERLREWVRIARQVVESL